MERAAAISRGGELKTTVALALPMMLGQGTQVLMHVVNTAMVGQLGVGELAAAAMGNNAVAVFFSVGVALGSTVPALVARAFGAGDRARMNLLLRHGLTVSLLYAAGCTLLFAALGPRLLPWFGPADLVERASPYALMLVGSLVPVLLVQNLRGFAEAQNHPWLPFGNIVLGVGLNVGLNYVLVYGHAGAPALGLTGAGLGTLLARLAMLGHFIWVLQRRPEIAPMGGWWRPARWAEGLYPAYLGIAVPAAAMIVVLFGNTVVSAAMMGRIGAAELAANEIARPIHLLLFTLPLGFSFAVAIRVGQAAGAGDWAAVRRIAGPSVLAAGAAMALAGGIVVLGREELPTWFLGAAGEQGEGGAVLGLSVVFLTLVACSVPADGVIVSSVGVFRGLAALRVPAVMYVLGMWAVGLPLAAVLGFGRGEGGEGIFRGLMWGNWITAASIVGWLGWTLTRRLPGDNRNGGRAARGG